MSKIYRRPMFRGGGKVSSYGNGIATGLADGGRVGYEMGGNVRGGVVKLPGGYALTANQRALLFDPAKTGSFNQPDTRAQTYGTKFGGATSSPIKTGGGIIENAVNNAKTNTGNIKSGIKSGIGSIKSGIGKMQFDEKGLLKGLKQIPGYLDKGVGALRTLGKRNPYLATAAATGYVTRDLPIDELIYEQEGYGPIEGKARKLLDPTYTSKIIDIYKQGVNEDGEFNAKIALEEEKAKPTPDQQKIADLLEELRLAKEIKDEGEGEVLVEETRKERLKRTAKEYQEILGDGIKKDSIFDAMVTGGTALMEGQGFSGAAREVNKSLDPIQNIKTAANKAALEEDIAVRRALAVSKGKRTATGELLDFYKSVKGADGKRAFTDLDISAKLAKGDSKADKIVKYKDAYGTAGGFKEYVKVEYGSNIKFFDVDIEKVDFETIEDGVYYQPPTGKADKYKDKFVTVKDGKAIKITPRTK